MGKRWNSRIYAFIFYLISEARTMKTLLILWMAINSGVATNSVKSLDMPSLKACEEYARVAMADKSVMAYQCIEGYSLPNKGR